MKICLNLHVGLVDPERLAKLDVGDEQGELAIKVQQENPGCKKRFMDATIEC